MKYTCIYCTQQKEETEFNREHVVPRMMGRYTNGLVLSDHQVCQQCNSFFSTEIEDKIGLDSYEALLRMHLGTRKMSNGRKLREIRLNIIGTEGIFKGLRFTPIADAPSPERMRFEIAPCIGFKVSDQEYQYFSIEEISDATEEKLQDLKRFANRIIQFGYEQEQVETILKAKGYITDDATYLEKNIVEDYHAPEFLTSVEFSIDSLVRRVCAKTIFNFLCWNNSPEYMLSAKFDSLREYILNGTWNDDLWFRYSIGFVSTATPPNTTAHVVGTMIYNNNGMWELLGCITWFGEITYIMKICNLEPTQEKAMGNGVTGIDVPSINTSFMYFNNETTMITTEDAIFIYGGR